MIESLSEGDRLVMGEISRLGRSLGQVIAAIDDLVKRKRKIKFIAIKESIKSEDKQDLQR